MARINAKFDLFYYSEEVFVDGTLYPTTVKLLEIIVPRGIRFAELMAYCA